MSRDERPCVQQGICISYFLGKPKVAHNPHTSLAETRIHTGFQGVLLMGEVSDHRLVKEHSGAKDSLESVHKTAISLPAFEQAEEVADC